MGSYRLFIAAELPATIKAELVAIQAQLRRADLPASWVAPGAMHLTLRFLGDTDEALLPELGRALQAALVSHSAMLLRLNGVGAFPNIRRPNVVWAGVGGAVAALQRAQADIEAALAGLGIAPDPKTFHPHLTLGRLRRAASPQQLQLGDAIRALPRPAPLEWLAERVVLFSSELRSGGPIYTEIVDYRLQIER
jgi:2'-5' RNA ligase